MGPPLLLGCELKRTNAKPATFHCGGLTCSQKATNGTCSSEVVGASMEFSGEVRCLSPDRCLSKDPPLFGGKNDLVGCLVSAI